MYRSKTVERMQRDWERERARYMETIRELTDRLMYATGHTWTPPPAVTADHDHTEPVLAFEDYGPEFSDATA